MTLQRGTTTAGLVGRTEELAQLAAQIDAARAGRGGAVGIEADPGLGKTALADAAAAQAADGTATVLWCRGVQAEIELPYSGLHTLLRPLLDDAPLPPGPRAALESALSLGTDTPLSNMAIAMAALELVAAVATRQRPLLLIFDDFQWLDAETATIATFLADRVAHDPVVLLSTARPTPDVTLPGTPIPLAPLDHEAVGELAAHLVGRPVHTTVATALHRATGGNPLAIKEVVRVFDLDRFGSELDELPATEVIRRTFAQRIAGLSATARDALLVVATSLDASTAPIIAALDVLSIPAAGLDAAVDAGIVRRTSSDVEFTHPLLEAVVADAGTPTLRRRIHRALAQTVPDPVSRAWHAAAASTNTDAQVADDLAAAAAELARRGGGVGAARAYERAGQLHGDAEIAAHHFYEAGIEARRSGRQTWAVELFEAAQARTDSPRLNGRITYQLALVDGYLGEVTSIGDRMADAARMLEPVDRTYALEVWDDTLLEFVLDGEIARALELLDQVDAVVQPQTDVRPVHAVAYVRLIAGVDSVRAAAQLRDHARASIAAPWHTAYSTMEACTWIGELDLARELADALRRPQGTDHVHDELIGTGYDGLLLTALGDWSGALLALERAEAQARAAGLGWTVRMMMAYQAIIRGCRGESLVEPLTEELTVALGANSQPLVIPAIASALGAFELANARPERAIPHLERAERWSREAGYVEAAVFPWPADLVEAYADAGRPADARAALERLRRVAETTQRASALAAVARLDGLLHPGDGFDQFFRQALVFEDSTPSAFAAARTRLLWARRLRHARRTDDAAAILNAAESGFRSLRAEGWLRRVEDERRGVGATPSAAVSSLLAELTRQEIAVAECVAQGMRNKEIAAHLFLTVKTIEWHLRQIYRKLDIRSRVQLAAYVNGVGADAAARSATAGNDR